jgi:hypothetical protein
MNKETNNSNSTKENINFFNHNDFQNKNIYKSNFIRNTEKPKKHEHSHNDLLQQIPTNIKTKLSNFLLNSTEIPRINHPSKLKMKDFERLVSPNIKEINKMIKKCSYNFKRIGQDSTLSTEDVLAQVQESITVGSMASAQIENMFSGNGLDVLGSSLGQLGLLNRQIYYSILKVAKTKEKKHCFPDLIKPIQNETQRWKMYAIKLEGEIKQIQTTRINTKLKQEIAEDLNIFTMKSI